MHPAVSIIINCFNGEKYLKQCITSVLNQTYSDWEIVFWDNQSTDNSKKICLSFNDKRIKYYRSSMHTNLYTARNLALKQCSGSFIAFLDTDDYWMNEKLLIQMRYFKDKKIGLVCSNFIFLNEMNNKIKIWHSNEKQSGYVLDELLYNYYIGLPTVIIRKETLSKMNNPFNTNYNIIGDFDLFTRIAQFWKVKYIHQPLATYRWHGKNLAFNETDREIVELNIWFSDIENESKISKSNKLIYVKHKLNYLIGKEFLRKKEYKKAIISLIKTKNFNLFLRLLTQIIIPNNLIIFLKKFKFR